MASSVNWNNSYLGVTMIRSLLKSIQEAATSLLSDTETMCDEEIADFLSQAELEEFDNGLWDMVEMTQWR